MPTLAKIEEDNALVQPPSGPHMPTAAQHRRKGMLLMRAGREQAAQLWFQRAIELDAKQRTAYKLLADHYEKAGDKQQAADYRKLAEPE